MIELSPQLLLAVAAAGGIGAVLRHLLSNLKGFLPWGTLIANISATAIGAIAVNQVTALGLLEVTLVAGLAGGMSTFSTVIGQTYQMLSKRAWMPAAAYVLASFVIPSTVVLAVGLFT